MGRHVVVGKGPVGSTLAELLRERGEDIVVLSRSGGDGSRVVDATDAQSLAEAARGADAIYNCANPAYTRWARDWPPIATALLDAAERTGAVLVTTSNLYGYGEVDRPMTEDMPLAATGVKGRVRAQMWEQALARHRAGRVRVAEARASDFVGPAITDGGLLGSRVVPRVLAGKPVRVLGDPDVPHSWTSVVDVARVLTTLGSDPRGWGQAWHVPTAPPVSARDAVSGLCRAAGVEPVTVRALPGGVLRAVGLVVPTLRELRETDHQRVRPFVLDSTAWTRTFEDEPTPLDQTWDQTVAWWQRRAVTPA